MNIFVKHLYLLLFMAILAIGQEARAAETTPGTATKPAPKAIPLSGKVLETMDGGGYTYLLLQNGSEKVWVAVPQTKVAVGEELSLVPGFEIKNFTSKGLNRKFDRLIFSVGLPKKEMQLSPSALKMLHKGTPAAAEKAPVPEPKAEKAPGTEPQAPISVAHIAKAKGKNAYTIAQLYAKRDALEKKQVVVRGKVVNVSTHILKRNWVHIQDGSGSPAKKNNNLVITTKNEPKVGDVITAKGTLLKNINLGSGYRYDVLVDTVTPAN